MAARQPLKLEIGVRSPIPQQKFMNHKNERIKKLWERGVRDPAIIARKIGYTGNAITAGIERVKQALKALGFIQ